MDDALALLVGKVILASAKLDQTLWGQIGHLAVAKRDLDRTQGQIRTTAEETDDRFSRRLKHFRRLSLELAPNNQKLMSEIDRTLHEIKDIERIRAHLAHGCYLGSCGTTPCNGNARPEGDNRNLLSGDDQAHYPQDIEKLTAFPNPFDQTIYFEFHLPYGQPVTLDIYDAQSRLLKRLVDKILEEGEHTFEWQTEKHPAGIYFARLQGENGRQTLRLVKMD